MLSVTHSPWFSVPPFRRWTCLMLPSEDPGGLPAILTSMGAHQLPACALLPEDASPHCMSLSMHL